MKATVVIVTYNRFALLKECLECVEQQKRKFDYVVIVDNKCTDGTTNYLKNYVDKYHIIFEAENGGGAKGFYDGIKYVHDNLSTDWILLIDDDAMLDKNYLEEIINAATIMPEIKAFSGSVVTDGKIDMSHRKHLVLDKDFRLVPVSINEYSKKFFEYDLSSFCGLIFHSSLVDEIGYPKAEYFIWYDDSEYSLRIREKTKLLNINSAQINHKTKLSNRSAALNWRGYYGTRNGGDLIKRYGTKKHFSRFVKRIRLAQIKNLIFYALTFNNIYKHNSNLYRDALHDLENEKLGFNPKYHA